MIAWLAPAVVAGGLLALVVVRLQLVADARATLVSYQLRFPRQLPAEAVQRFLAGWSGSLPPVWKRWLVGVPPLVLEARARPQDISHHLLVPKRWSALVESLLGAHLPSVRYTQEPVIPLQLTHAAEYRTNTSQRALTIDAPALSIGLLASLQPLGKGERLVVQYVIGAHAPVQPPRVKNGHGKPWWLNDPRLVDNSEAATALRKKQASPLRSRWDA